MDRKYCSYACVYYVVCVLAPLFLTPLFLTLCFLTPCCLLLRRCPAPFVLFACLRLCLVSVLSFTVVHFVICCCPLLSAAFLGRPLLAAVAWSVSVSCPLAASSAIRVMPSHASVVCLCFFCFGSSASAIFALHGFPAVFVRLSSCCQYSMVLCPVILPMQCRLPQ